MAWATLTHDSGSRASSDGRTIAVCFTYALYACSLHSAYTAPRFVNLGCSLYAPRYIYCLVTICVPPRRHPPATQSAMVAILISPILVCLMALVAVDAAPTKRSGNLPDFVTKYAPLSYLHSKEQYWPSDVKTHLTKVIPQVNFKPVGGTPTLQTLSSLANGVSLTATDNILKHNSAFFTSIVGKPTNGVSGVPGTIIAVEKPGGIIDAFYFYFYSWNYGNA